MRLVLALLALACVASCNVEAGCKLGQRFKNRKFKPVVKAVQSTVAPKPATKTVVCNGQTCTVTK